MNEKMWSPVTFQTHAHHDKRKKKRKKKEKQCDYESHCNTCLSWHPKEKKRKQWLNELDANTYISYPNMDTHCLSQIILISYIYRKTSVRSASTIRTHRFYGNTIVRNGYRRTYGKYCGFVTEIFVVRFKVKSFQMTKKLSHLNWVQLCNCNWILIQKSFSANPAKLKCETR